MHSRQTQSWIPVLAAALLSLTGCVGGPSYAGGPTSEEPHGIISPGKDVTVWKIDGYPTETRVFNLYVAPGRRRLNVRVEHAMESDSAEPREIKDITVYVEEGVIYHLMRKESQFPPWEVQIVEERPGPRR